MRFSLLFRAIFAFLAFAACSKKPGAEECRQMLDRYGTMRGGPTSKAANDGYRRAEAQCKDEVSRKEWDCAMEAGTPNDWEACIE
jgi:hypothetical protein